MPDAVDGASAFGCPELSKVLKEILYYYHSNGRSKLKKRIPEGFFDDIPSDWNKTLAQLEDEFYEFRLMERPA